MGGTGSGRWGNHKRKLRMEECLTFSLDEVKRQGAFRSLEGGCREGSVRWIRSDGTELASAGFRVVSKAENVFTLTLSYRVDDNAITLPITVQSKHQRTGGARYWFICPICRKHVLKLHLPRDGRGLRFACRSCWDLSYRSVQEAHAKDGIWRLLAAHSSGRLTFEDLKLADRMERRLRK